MARTMARTKEGMKLRKTWDDVAVGDEVTSRSLIESAGKKVVAASTQRYSSFLCRMVRQGLAERTKTYKGRFDRKGMVYYRKVSVKQCVEQQTETQELSVVKKDDSDEILYKQLQSFVKRLGVNIVGKKRADAIELVLDGIVAHYTPAKENLSQEDFEEYKRENSDMLDWFNENKDYEHPEEDSEQEYEDPEEFKDELKPKDVSEEVLAEDTGFTVLQLGESILKVIDNHKSEISMLNGVLNQERRMVQELVEEKQRVEDLYKQAQEKIIELNSTKNTKVFKLADLQAFHSSLAVKE